jgi:hypothetical protein
MKKPRPDITAMVFGLVFMGISGWWFLARRDGFGLSSLGFILAGLLIVVGIAGITTALRNSRP